MFFFSPHGMVCEPLQPTRGHKFQNKRSKKIFVRFSIKKKNKSLASYLYFQFQFKSFFILKFLITQSIHYKLKTQFMFYLWIKFISQIFEVSLQSQVIVFYIVQWKLHGIIRYLTPQLYYTSTIDYVLFTAQFLGHGKLGPKSYKCSQKPN